MDSSEVMLRQRFEAEVGSLSPDSAALARAGHDSGRRLLRRRRLQGGVGIVAAVALVVGGAAYVGGATGPLGAKPVQPAAPPTLTQVEAATPRGLAAAVMTHTDGLGALVYAAGEAREDAEFPLSATVGYGLGGRQTVSLTVRATPKVAMWNAGTCEDLNPANCQHLTLPDGTRLVIMQEPATSSPESMGATLTVLALRDDQIVMVSQRSMGSDDGPLGVDALTAIATDPTVGMSTTAALNAAGTDIVDFETSLVTVEGESGSVTPTTAPTAG